MRSDKAIDGPAVMPYCSTAVLCWQSCIRREQAEIESRWPPQHTPVSGDGSPKYRRATICRWHSQSGIVGDTDAPNSPSMHPVNQSCAKAGYENGGHVQTATTTSCRGRMRANCFARRMVGHATSGQRGCRKLYHIFAETACLSSLADFFVCLMRSTACRLSSHAGRSLTDRVSAGKPCAHLVTFSIVDFETLALEMVGTTETPFSHTVP